MRNGKTANAFWTGAIVVSLLLVLFSLFFVSCVGKSEAVPEPSPAKTETETPENEQPPEAQTGGEQTGTEQQPGGNQSTAETPTAQTPDVTAPAQRPPQDATTLSETEDMGREYLDKFVFLGDSTTYGLGYYYSHGYTDLVPPEQIWTPANGTLTLDQWNYVNIVYPQTGEELKLTDLLELTKPGYICITLGVNGVSFMSEDYFKESYSSLVKKIQEISPDTTIVLNSIYPVTVGYEAKNNGINNLKIEAANLWVHDVAKACGVHYLDSASVLMNEQRVLPDNYTNGDGLHLNGESFRLVIDYLRTHGC